MFTPYASLAARRTPMSGCKCWRTSAVCFGAALAARVGTGVYHNFSEAQRDLRHPVRTLLPDMTAHQLYQKKYQRYQHLIAALQGFHARIKEHTL